MDQLAYMRIILLLCITAIGIVSTLSASINDNIRGERDLRRRIRRDRDAQELQQHRYAHAGGRAMGRTSTTFASVTAQAMRSQTQGEVLDEAGILPREDLERAYDAVDGPPRHQYVQEAFEMRAEERDKLKKELAEPFWAWHERREHETKRVGIDDSTGSSTSVRVRSGPSSYGYLSDNLALGVRNRGVGGQSADRQDAITARVDETDVGTSST